MRQQQLEDAAKALNSTVRVVSCRCAPQLLPAAPCCTCTSLLLRTRARALPLSLARALSLLFSSRTVHHVAPLAARRSPRFWYSHGGGQVLNGASADLVLLGLEFKKLWRVSQERIAELERQVDDLKREASAAKK